MFLGSCPPRTRRSEPAPSAETRNPAVRRAGEPAGSTVAGRAPGRGPCARSSARSARPDVRGVEVGRGDGEPGEHDQEAQDDQPDSDEAPHRDARPAHGHEVEGQAAHDHEPGADAKQGERERLEDERQRHETEADDRALEQAGLSGRQDPRGGDPRPEGLGGTHRTRRSAASKTWVWAGRGRTWSRLPTSTETRWSTTTRSSCPPSTRWTSVSAPIGSIRSTRAASVPAAASATRSRPRGRMPSVTGLPAARRETAGSTARAASCAPTRNRRPTSGEPITG